MYATNRIAVLHYEAAWLADPTHSGSVPASALELLAGWFEVAHQMWAWVSASW
jgi:hypothetical protein